MSLLNEGYWSQRSIATDRLGDEYCLVPATNFLFGNSKTSTRIKAAFYVAKYQVTRRRFEAFIAQTGYDYSDADRQLMYRLSPHPDCPATPVSFTDAKNYARWLRATTEEYYSLPSVEEWEISARGTDGRLYPWGNEEPDEERMRYSGSMLKDTTKPVGSFPVGESPFGCMDMVGNVWEWVVDQVDEEGQIRLLRGGGCTNNVHYCNCVVCCYSAPMNKRVLYAGFRLIYLTADMFRNYVAAASDG